MSVDWNTVDGALAQAREGIALFWERVPDVLHDPRAYPREAMTLAVTAALAVVLLMLAVLLVMSIVGDIRKRRRLRARRRPEFYARRVLSVIGAVVAVLAVFAALSATTWFAPACSRCHAVNTKTAQWKKDAHSSVSCARCHAQPGVSGAVGWTVNVVACSTGNGSKWEPASDAACLKCHREDLEGVVVSDGIKVRHEDLYESGSSCTDCHPEVGHALTGSDDSTMSASSTDEGADASAVMSRCVRCHDGDRAPSGCTTCHVGSPSDTDIADRPVQANVLIDMTCSGGCHSRKVSRGCVNCHGLELPHPDEFFGQHAGRSADDPELCMRCHETASHDRPCGCHTEENIHGTFSAWFPQHGAAALKQWPGGCNCHRSNFCGLCHSSVPDGPYTTP